MESRHVVESRETSAANDTSAIKPIVVIGSSNVDFIMGVAQLPGVGETVPDGSFLQTYGGKGANQAVAAARAGGNVTFVTGLGEDVYAAPTLANFRADGIRTDRVLVAPGVASGSALIMFDREGNNYITVAPGANYALTPEYIDSCADVIQGAGMLVMQMELAVPTTLHVLEVAERYGVPTMFNYAPVRQCEIPVSERIAILVVNEHEGSALTGLPITSPTEAEVAAQALRKRGPSIVVVTLGAAGACIVSEEGSIHQPAFAVTPVDTTAAGDVFCGALAVALVEGRALRDAVRFANAASAISVTRTGAQPSIPMRAAIDAFLVEN